MRCWHCDCAAVVAASASVAASHRCHVYFSCNAFEVQARKLSRRSSVALSLSLYLVLPVVALSLSLHPLSFALLCVCCVYFVVVVQVCGARVALGSRKQLICTLPKAAAAEAVAEAAAAATTAGIAATTTTTAKGMCAVGYSCVDFTQSFSSSSPHSA